ncbi:Do family serine endopeptidase [Thalassomonas sp. M1454]|uniref:Do family serine endopeptidase n=1 Tax=Thalassomonas sp. M1454 TaxID=2594477 RepID=UPI00117D98C6|nr:Do family serine endopeptidase [Thalassomonas sp. M1454]TRX52768.1 Do family serine endopeptidase [Thalassomonas sp. M1454]
MKKISSLSRVALVVGSLSLFPALATAALPMQVDGQPLPSLAPMLEYTTPGVVSISVAGTHEVKQQVPDAFKFFFGQRRGQQQAQERPFRGLGSGVIIDAKNGYVVTNNHVIDQADEILVTLKDGRQIEAKKIGTDAASDIALLQIKADDLVAVKIADSDDIKVGDFAVAIGSPFGLGQTVTSGIVSALGRSGLNIENLEDFIQTDAAINSGNSGGALVNLRGELIGINTAILGPSGGNVGIGFAIPSNMMQNLTNQIIEFGEVRRGVLGITGNSINPELAKAMDLATNQGGFVSQVSPDSAAEEAGIKAGDIIIAVNGKKVKSFNALRGKIGSIGAGKKVKITLLRDGDEKTVTVKLQSAPDSQVAAANLHPMLEGAELSNNESNQGVDVNNLASNSPAASTGLKKGDVIAGVNRQRVRNIAELRSALEGVEGVVALNVIRGNSELYLMIR